MKKLFLTMLVAFMAMTSCEKSDLGGSLSGETAMVTISAEAASATRAVATDDLTYYVEIYLGDEATLKEYDAETLAKARYFKDSQKGNGFFEVELLTGQDYMVLAWADYAEGYYDTDNLSNVTIVEGKYKINTSDRDAFAGAEAMNVSKDDAIEMSLVRPFGRVNVTSTDDIPTGFEPATVAIEYQIINTTYNILTGKAGTPTDENTFTVIATEVIDVEEGEIYLSADYLLVSKDESATVAFKQTYYDSTEEDASAITSYTFSNIPIQPNYQTNVSGKILTDGGSITIDVTEEWTDTEEYELTEVTSQAELITALEDGDNYIIISEDFELSELITISGDVIINGATSGASMAQTRSDESTMVTLSSSATDAGFVIEGSLTLNNIEIISNLNNSGDETFLLSSSNSSLTINDSKITMTTKYGRTINMSGSYSSVALNNTEIFMESTSQSAIVIGKTFSNTSNPSLEGISIDITNSKIRSCDETGEIYTTKTSSSCYGLYVGFVTNMSVNIVGSEIAGMECPISTSSTAYISQIQDSEINIDDSQILGHYNLICATNLVMNITNSEITGNNYSSSSTYYTLRLFRVLNCTFNIDNSTISGNSYSNSVQYAIQNGNDSSATGNVMNFSGDVSLVNTATNETKLVDYLIYDSDTSKESMAFNTADANMTLVGKENVKLTNKILLGGGTAEDPYRIYNYEDFSMMKYNLSAHYIQMADVAVNDGSTGWMYSPGYELSTEEDPFQGTYDGNGYKFGSQRKIMVYTDHTALGLFCVVGDQGVIKNLIVENTESEFIYYTSTYKGTEALYIGSIAGISSGTIENCSIDATINLMTMTKPEGSVVGSLVGYLKGDGVIKNCTFSGVASVATEGDTSRTLVGKADNEDNIVGCSFSAE